MSNTEKILESVFGNKTTFKRVLFFIIFIVILAIGIAEYILFRLSKIDNLKLDFNEDGATLIYENNKLSKAEFLLTSSKCWVNSGINIPKNSKIQFSVSGSATLGIHHVVESAKDNTKPISDWIDFYGTDFKNENSKDWERKFVYNKACFGQIIGCFHETGTPEPGRNNLSPPKMFIVPKDFHDMIESPDYQSTLWLTVNDEVMDLNNKSEAEKQYIGGRHGVEKDEASKHFKNVIVKQDLWNLWFKDNSGQFLLKLDITR